MTTKTQRRRRRPAWKGQVRFNLVTLAVQAYPARVKDGSDIDLDWLHEGCGQRVRYQKICPVHGEISSDEIVSAYRVGKDRYVEFEPEDLDRLLSPREKAVSVDVFISPDAIDALYFTERNYYLLPEDSESARPYLVFYRAMVEQNRWGLAQTVLFKREQMVLIRPLRGVLAMTVLNYADDFQRPAQVAVEIPRVKISSEELDLATRLVQAGTVEDFDFAKFKDVYAERVRRLVEAKLHGREPAPAAEEPEPPATVDFTEALRQSIARARQSARQAPRRRKVS